MQNKRLALLLIFASVLVAGAVLALASGMISPETATVNEETTFTYNGDGTVTEWCFTNPGGSERCGRSSSFTFTRTGRGAAKVSGNTEAGPFEYTETVTVN